jgi:hypothetical protein
MIKLTKAAKPVSVSEKTHPAKMGFFTSLLRLILKTHNLNEHLKVTLFFLINNF